MRELDCGLVPKSFSAIMECVLRFNVNKNLIAEVALCFKNKEMNYAALLVKYYSCPPLVFCIRILAVYILSAYILCFPQFNGVNLRNAKETHARAIMSQTQPGDNIKFLVQYNLESRFTSLYCIA